MRRSPADAPPDPDFRDAVGPVRALRPTPARAALAPRRRPPPAAPPPRPAPPPLAPGPPVAAGTRVSWRRAGVQERALRALRGARFDAQAQCDLHGCTVARAEVELAGFLERASAQGLRRVRVIHGRGEGVLKNACLAQLRAHAAVLACASAGPIDGGPGALRVLLRTGAPAGAAR